MSINDLSAYKVILGRIVILVIKLSSFSFYFENESSHVFSDKYLSIVKFCYTFFQYFTFQCLNQTLGKVALKLDISNTINSKNVQT